MNDRRSRREQKSRPEHSADQQWSSRSVRDTLASPAQGTPLSAATAQQLGTTLGHDFSDIRVHDDAEEDRIARELDARALTSEPHIYFRGGAYAPETSDGLRVVAHEAAHVAQQ